MSALQTPNFLLTVHSTIKPAYGELLIFVDFLNLCRKQRLFNRQGTQRMLR